VVVGCSARHASMLRVGATTMRCRRCSGKFRAVHIDVTTLLTFPAALRVIVGGQNFSSGTARTAMKMTAFAAAIAVAVGAGGGAYAQGYPSHPITMIVPFPAGGPTDTPAPILNERMRPSLRQPLVLRTRASPRPRHR